MPSVTIGSNEYDVYADLPTADAYLAAQISATDWNDPATTDDMKSAALVSMTRTIDRQQWQGTQTDGYETHAFPRTDLKYADGTEVDPNIVPDAVVNACMEGAAQLVGGAAFQDAATTFNNVKDLKAGTVDIAYFRTIDESPRFPQVVMELIGLWLNNGSGGVVGSLSSGTGRRTTFNDTYDVRQGF
ncbi:MAG TPA: DnaT-like ssDNA-binding protein [Caulobacteraceae bacterium]